MNSELSTGERFAMTEKSYGGSQMESKSIEKIKEIKSIKKSMKLTYMEIVDEMKELDFSTAVSLSSLRRVCSNGSESKASSFNYDEIIAPIYNAVKSLEKKGKPEVEDPFEIELEGYKAVIAVQNEELDRLFEMKELLDGRVDFLINQIQTKDAMISDLLRMLGEKESTIKLILDQIIERKETENV